MRSPQQSDASTATSSLPRSPRDGEERAARIRIGRVVLPYVVFSALWVLFSDLLVGTLITDAQTRTQASILKGLLFVAATAGFLYWLLRLEAGARERSAARQRESELRYREVFTATGDAILLCDRCGVVLERNESSLRLFGDADNDALGRPLSDYCRTAPPYSAIEFAAILEKALGGEKALFEWIFVRPDGSHFWAEVSLRNSDGQGMPLIFAARDVTRRRQIEEDLRLSRLKFEAVFRGFPDILYISLFDTGVVVDANDRFLACFGGRAEVIGRTTLELDIWSSENERRRYLDAMTANQGRIADFPVRGKLGGKVCDLLISGFVLSVGGVKMLLTSARDVTDRSAAERELTSIRTWLERAEKIGHVGGWSIDCDQRRMWASEEARRIYGLDSNACLELSFIQSLPLPAYRPRLDRALAELVEKGAPYDLEFELQRATDGTIATIHSVAEFDSSTRFVYGVIQDVSARRKIERKNEELATLLDIANDAIHVRDLGRRITYWNKSAERIYGWLRIDAVGRLSSELFDKEDEASEQIGSALIDHGSWSGERRHCNKKGEGVIVFSRLTLVRDGAGRPAAVMAIETDITERKQLEVQFLRAQRLESLGSLSSGIAHDLNNVLAPILLAAPLLRDEVRTKLGLSVLASLESSARRGADIVKQVLTFARGAEGEKQLLNPESLLSEMQRIALETFPKNIHVSLTECPEAWSIMADATQVHQALMNLCVNARDAMPSGGTLTLSLANLDADEKLARKLGAAAAGPYLVFHVRDSGMGIPSEHLDKIFDPFFTTKPIGKGTGLGLATVLGIMKGHQGFVSVDSEVGQGTCIALGFPAMASKNAGVEGNGGDPVVHRGEGETVLLVDDEPAVRDTIQQLLEKYGYKVMTAGDGAEAVGIFAQNRESIDLLLSDMMMPGMDGPSLVRVIRRIKTELSVIGMSGVGDPATLNAIDSLKLDAFMNKPFTEEALLGAMRRVLRRKRRSGGKGLR